MYCPACDMWLNGMGQYNDHVLRKKHRNNLNKRVGHEQWVRRDKGLVIPRGTAIIIEQGAILSDATELGHVGSASADASQLGGCSAMASGPPMYLGMHTHGVFTYSPMYCPACEISPVMHRLYSNALLRSRLGCSKDDAVSCVAEDGSSDEDRVNSLRGTHYHQRSAVSDRPTPGTTTGDVPVTCCRCL